jgi:hypothetical protein
MWTDYALASVNAFFAIRTYSGMNPRNRVTGLLLLLGYTAQALSSLAGGTFHGFALYMQDSTRQSLWNLTMLTAGATVSFFASGVHAAHVRREHGMRILGAVAVAVGGLLIQLSGFRRRQPFNHNDIFHVIVIVSMYLFYRAVQTLQDRSQ